MHRQLTRKSILSSWLIMALTWPSHAIPTRPTNSIRVAAIAIAQSAGKTNPKQTAQVRATLLQSLALVPGISLINQTPKCSANDAALAAAGSPMEDETYLTCLRGFAQKNSLAKVLLYHTGGLSGFPLLHLRAISVGSEKPQSLVVELQNSAPNDLVPSLVKLLNPSAYYGELIISASLPDATLWINGKSFGKIPQRPVKLGVGTHALRVTHPEARDFVQFVDIRYGKKVPVRVVMSRYSETSQETWRGSKRQQQQNSPWYGRWYVWAAAGALFLGGAAWITYELTSGREVDREIALP